MFGIKKRLGRLEKLFTSKAIILMYHSITEPDIDPWELAVSPSNFEQQLQVLQNSFKISSVSNIVISLQKGRLKNKTVALTFDDGYRDNFESAKPLLEKYNIPASFFITSISFCEEKLFWWDKLADIILRTPILPANFNIKMGGEIFNDSIKGEGTLNEYLEQLHRDWVIPGPPPTKRSTLYYKLWQLMLPLPPVEIDKMLQEIEKWAGNNVKKMQTPASLMTEQQLKNLADHPLIDIGLHTVNHVALNHHSAQVQESEILQNKKDLEQIVNRKITTIAYPYGEYSSTTLGIVEKIGLQAGFSVDYNPVNKASDPFKLGRFQVKNWNAKQFEENLVEWMKL
jgi:peptidoglycan/xylan/chitin deacetylase (PgdA/CDA1 family)